MSTKREPSVKILKIPRREEVEVGEEWKVLTPGTRWECLKCGDCCRRPYRVNITWVEFKRATEDQEMREKFRVDGVIIDPETGLSHPFFNISGGCPFLDPETNLCTIYPKRFYTCATWPFLLHTDGRIYYSTECPGFGRGPLVDPWKVLSDILYHRERAGMITEEDRVERAKRWIERNFGKKKRYLTPEEY
ncbi:MAG: YkgJ family cysteine cluster protein [Thermoplasmata archaeon]|nr:YkgJ family cysteine cluster protein [Thermoplasmata archaeon]